MQVSFQIWKSSHDRNVLEAASFIGHDLAIHNAINVAPAD